MKKKLKLEIAFHNYLQEINQIESYRWQDLSPGEIQALVKWHFKIFLKELKHERKRTSQR